MGFRPSNPEQACLVPPNVRDGLGEAPFCFFTPVVVEKLDLRALEAVSEEAGRAALFAGLDGHPGGA
jgi:hypothetical protein